METKNELEDNPQQYEQSEKELETHINDNFSTCSTPSPSKNEQEIINTIEEEIGKQLDEKAEKSNLTVVNVKNIIREVLTNEHMKLLFDKSLSADGTIMSPLYELRLTRARTKKLLSSTPFSPILDVPWVPQPDLKKKDSRDNCIPSKNESDDESNISETDLGSIPPSTPPTPIYSEDLVNPASYTEEDVEEKEVGGEVQELALNSSDVESDDGDDEEWIKFVENFTMPIEEISKPNEEEDQDPEYNILADDEMNEVDTEDFREDKAVKISKTEVKKLWEELFDCLGDISECGGPVNYKDKNSTEPNESPLDTSPQEYNNSSNIEINNQTRVITKDEPSSLCNNQSSNTASYELVMDSQQICIFTQQFRQHVQMLTQNFILTYQHPEYNHYSDSLHEYLLNLKVLSADKPFSWFKPTNLQPALDLIDAWIKMFASNTKAVKEAKGHIQNDLARSMAYKMAGNYDYVLTLPKLILETISKSEVFIYPFLLPKIPLKPVQFFKDRSGFTKAEDSLLVFGFHLFKQFLTEELMQKKVTMTEIVSFVQKYMMPHKNPESILRYIRRIKHPKYPTNPIKQYLQYGEIQPFTHYIHPFNYVVPPCRRMPNELPYQWRQFLYPNQNDNMAKPVENGQKLVIFNTLPVPVLSPILMTYTPENSNSSSLENIIALPSQNSSSTLVNTSFHNSSSISVLNNSAEDGSTVSRSAPINHFVSVFCRPISVQKLIRFLAKQEQNEATSENCSNERVPGNLNMPDLNTYVKNIKEENKTIGADNLELSRDNLTQQNNITKGMLTITNSENNRKERSSETLELFTITSSCFQNNDTSTEVGFCRDSRVIQCGETIQCNDDIPSAGGCNSGVRTRGKDNKSGKKVLGAQKKMRDDFLATSEDPDTEKRENENFAVVYYDKLRETLEVEDYHSVMQVINDFTSGDVVDLYSDMEVILCPKYAELAEEFLLFLKEKEANAAKQLIPWLEVQVRIKFLRKLEMYLQDQPAQLKRIYSTLMELAKEKDVAKEKVKTNLLQFFKGNTILNDLFLECLGNDHHPASLTESSYGTMAMHKEMSMPVHEELFETFDECGESNSSCYCHRTEVDSDKRRYKHCHSCGLKFADKKLYLPTEKMFQPVTTNFKTNLNAEHNIRISGKSVTNHHKKKRSDNSPNELSDAYTTDDTKKDAGAGGINKCEKSISQQRPRKRRKIESTKCRDAAKPASLEKSHTGTNTSLVDSKYQPTTSPKKQKYFGEMPEQGELEKTRVIHTEQEIVVKVEPEEETEISLEPISYSDFEFIKVEGGCGWGNDDQQEKIPHGDYEFIKVEDGCELGTNDQQEKLTDACMHSPVELGRHKIESRSESPQESYESDDDDLSRGASESPTDTKSIDESPWKREEDSIILEILQKENDKEYALKIISDNLPNRTVSQIRGRLSSLLALLSETLNNI